MFNAGAPGCSKGVEVPVILLCCALFRSALFRRGDRGWLRTVLMREGMGWRPGCALKLCAAGYSCTKLTITNKQHLTAAHPRRLTLMLDTGLPSGSRPRPTLPHIQQPHCQKA